MRKITALLTALALAAGGLAAGTMPAEAAEPAAAVTVVSASTDVEGALILTVKKSAVTSTLAGEKAKYSKRLDRFVARYDGKYIDLDGVAGAQCVDLANRVVRSFYGIRTWVFGNAINWASSTDSRVLAHYDKLSASATPQKGDLMVQLGGAADSKLGHISLIYKDGTKVKKYWGQKRSTVYVFQQNAPKGGNPANLSRWPTWGVITYLRPVELVGKTKTTTSTTFKKLAKRYGVTVAQLKELNPKLAKKSRLSKGTTVVIRPNK